MSKRSRARRAAAAVPTGSRAAKATPINRRQARYQQSRTHRHNLVKLTATIAVAVAALAALFYLNGGGSNGGQQAYAFEIADPKPGSAAPPLRLAVTDGTTFDLADYRGQTVLLYFQEGIGCQACWDQLRDIEANFDPLRAVGVDLIATITSDPLDLLKQKGADEGLTTPLLSDPDLSVSASYGGNVYGMMGNAKNGHSFILVDGDGVIRWRADYGGPPRYTMYVPVSHLADAIREGLSAGDTADGSAH